MKPTGYLEEVLTLNEFTSVALDSNQMAELDRRMISEYRIELLMMMENAGRSLALQAARFLGANYATLSIGTAIAPGLGAAI